METAKIGKRGTFVIPVKLRQRFNIKEGDLFLAEEREDGILLHPAVAVPVDHSARKAVLAYRSLEFLGRADGQGGKTRQPIRVAPDRRRELVVAFTGQPNGFSPGGNRCG